MQAETEACIVPRGSVRHAATLGGWPPVVHKSFRQRSEAVELVKAMGSPETQCRRARQGDGAAPSILALYQDPGIVAVHPVLQAVREVIAGGGLAVRPIAVAGTRYTEVAALYADTVTSILRGETDAAPALADLARQLVELGPWTAGDHN